MLARKHSKTLRKFCLCNRAAPTLNRINLALSCFRQPQPTIMATNDLEKGSLLPNTIDSRQESRCPCSCHRRKCRTNKLLPKERKTLIGAMAVEYRGLPILNQSCSCGYSCKNEHPSISIEWQSPVWIPRAWRYYCKIGLNTKFQLAISKIVPNDAPSVLGARMGDNAALERLFRSGEASP